MKNIRSGRGWLAAALACGMTLGCAAQPATKAATPAPSSRPADAPADPQSIAAAKRFLGGIRAGESAVAAMQENLNRDTEGKPGMRELFARIMADVTPETFNELGAAVYARHLSRAHFVALADFSESPVGTRFFAEYRKQGEGGQTEAATDPLARFNADELTQIMKFVQSDAGLALQGKQAQISSEMRAEGEKLGRELLMKYLNQQASRP